MKVRVLLAAAVLGVAAAPFTASASSVCDHLPQLAFMNPEPTSTACGLVVSSLPPAVCDKVGVCPS